MTEEEKEKYAKIMGKVDIEWILKNVSEEEKKAYDKLMKVDTDEIGKDKTIGNVKKIREEFVSPHKNNECKNN